LAFLFELVLQRISGRSIGRQIVQELENMEEKVLAKLNT